MAACQSPPRGEPVAIATGADAANPPPARASDSGGPLGRQPEQAGLHNLVRFGPNLLSGSVPEGAAGFASLQSLGIRTIISVDGAAPEVELARQYNLRYVHLPISYGGIDRVQAERIAAAIEVLPGPFYLHCHHGKHRAPAAAATAQVLRGQVTPDAAIELMRVAGTDPVYAGLYAAARSAGPVSSVVLASHGCEFPERAVLPNSTAAMVAVDDSWTRLGRLHAAHWQQLPDEPDLLATNESVILAEQLREFARLSAPTRTGDSGFQSAAARSEQAAWELSRSLRAGDWSAAEAAYGNVKASCTACHRAYRD